MGNVARVTYPNPLSLSEYQTLVRETFDGLFDGTLELTMEPEQPGVCVYVSDGITEDFLFQVLYESPTEITVDHRHGGRVAYWVSDRFMHHIATKLGGVWQEDCLEEPEDLSKPIPDRFLPYALHGPVLKQADPEKFLRDFDGDLFVGKFAKFWSKG